MPDVFTVFLNKDDDDDDHRTPPPLPPPPPTYLPLEGFEMLRRTHSADFRFQLRDSETTSALLFIQNNWILQCSNKIH